MTTYTVICQSAITDDGFEHAETSKARAIKYAREFVAKNDADCAKASVVIYGHRRNGARCLVRQVYKCVNKFGRVAPFKSAAKITVNRPEKARKRRMLGGKG